MFLKSIIKIVVLSFLLTVLSVQGFCSDESILAEADPLQVNIADVINYQVSFVLPADAQIKQPFIKQGKLGDFEIKSFHENIKEDDQNKNQFILSYNLQIFKTGEFSIPAYTVEYRTKPDAKWQSLASDKIDIKVESLLPDKENLSLKPLKPKIIIWGDFLPWIIALFIIALIAGAIYYKTKTKNKTKEEQILKDPAHIIALRQLQTLKQEELIIKGKVKQYYTRLSDCLRQYVENRFALNALAMSTEEFLKKAKALPFLNAEQRSSLKDFLVLSDLVKFAKHGSTNQEAEKAFNAAVSFVEQTKEQGIEEESPKI